jgi:hypothetical protein
LLLLLAAAACCCLLLLLAAACCCCLLLLAAAASFCFRLFPAVASSFLRVHYYLPKFFEGHASSLQLRPARAAPIIFGPSEGQA